MPKQDWDYKDIELSMIEIEKSPFNTEAPPMIMAWGGCIFGRLQEHHKEMEKVGVKKPRMSMTGILYELSVNDGVDITPYQARKAIQWLRENISIFSKTHIVVANRQGYRLTDNKQEIANYLHSLEVRAISLNKQRLQIYKHIKPNTRQVIHAKKRSKIDYA